MSVIQKFAVGLCALIVFGLVFIHGASFPEKLESKLFAVASIAANEALDAAPIETIDRVESSSPTETPLAEQQVGVIPKLDPESTISGNNETDASLTMVETQTEPVETIAETSEEEAAAEVGAEIVLSEAEIARAAALEAARRCQRRIDRTMTGYQITFENNSVEISRGVARLLTELSFEFEECGQVRVEIRGHTDARGGADRNLSLSRRRANSVMAFLNRIGVGAVELTAMGFGESQPIASNNSETGRARNRRIEFLVSTAAPDDAVVSSSGDRPTESE